MKKAFDQTVRELKREVNKKVLKVPTIEQKVLDATSNEPWGPHGTLLADIALASTNNYECQMIMSIIWKRMNDNGKNWRHVYKALTVLEYLAANGPERVIDEIREHAYQIQTLSSFQYIDSKGRDQGNNVRKKSQTLVILVNDKDRIAEVRQKAAANRDKFRSIASTGGMYRPRSYSDFEGYGGKQDEYRYEGRYGSRDYDRDGYGGRGREWGRDDDRYRNENSYSYAGDKYGRDYEDRFGTDTYRDDDYRGRRRSIDGSQYASRGKSSERVSDQGFDDDGQHFPRNFSEQNLGAPPKYEEAVTESRSPDEGSNHRDVEKVASPAPKSPSPPPPNSNAGVEKNVTGLPVPPTELVTESTYDFNPRGPLSGQPAPSKTTDTDFLVSFSVPSSDNNTLALVPVTPLTTETELNNFSFSGLASTFPASAPPSTGTKQLFEDSFGDSPFKANGGSLAPQQSAPPSYPSTAGGPFSGLPSQQPSSQQYSTPNPNADIVAGILALPAPLPAEAPVTLSTAGIDPYGTVATGLMSAPTSIPTVSSHYYGTGRMQPQIYGLGTVLSQTGQGALVNSQPTAPQPPKENFQTKSTVWADTLSRGLVDLNISGSKTNPLADIGVDFDALNRKAKRLEKTPATTTAVSNITMGKAMGSGSGIGRSEAGSLRPPPSPMVGGSTPRWGGYGGMGMNMNMVMGQAMPMQRPNTPPSVLTPMVGSYNPMGGPGGYTQQSFGGVYR